MAHVTRSGRRIGRFPFDVRPKMTVRVRTSVCRGIPGCRRLIRLGQAGKGNVVHTIEVPRVAYRFGYGVAFDAIGPMFFVGSVIGPWTVFISVTGAAKGDALLVTASITAPWKNRAFRAIGAMTNLTIFDGISVVAKPDCVFASSEFAGPAAPVITFGRRSITRDLASRHGEHGNGEANPTVHVFCQGRGA